jgi:glucose/arabinose dehydrogenase
MSKLGRVVVALSVFSAGCLAEIGEPEVAEDTAQSLSVPSGFLDETIVAGLPNPTAMALAPDGRLFVCQQAGALRVIENGVLLPTPFVQLTVDSVGERGLLGVAFDPSFATTRHVYLYYTATTPTVHNRVSRFTASIADPDRVEAGSEVVLLELPTLNASNHNGGAIHFGRDGMLYVAVGENAVSSNSQSLTNPLGKLLRIRRDGSIPSDNPFYSATTGTSRAIWALGLRNPFTFDVHRISGDLFINDVGASSWEEINAGIAGANYGWPSTEGPTADPRFVSPIHAYSHSIGCAIAGGTFYDPLVAQFPSTYVDDYFFADLCGGFIRRLDVASGAVSEFATGASFPVDLEVGPDGALYYLYRGGSGGVGRIRSSSTTVPPSITQQPQSLTRAVGQSATFSVGATGSQPLVYQWRRNGTNITGATASSYTIASVSQADHGAQFSVRVSNAVGSVLSANATLSVSTSTAPVATITAPVHGSTYAGGDLVMFSATGTDAEDGTLPVSAFSWTIVFHHATHTHPFLTFNAVRSGTFTIPRTGETATDVFYRLNLQVQDSTGLRTTSSVDIVPRTSAITLKTVPAGLQITLDGAPSTAPLTVSSVEGTTRTIGVASTQLLNGQPYVFSAWSDGGGATHAITTPTADTSYTATFVSSTCAANEAQFGSHCYRGLPSALTYDSALTQCRALGASWSLVEIASSAENSFARGLLGGVERWLGATDRSIEGTFVWQSGVPFWSGGRQGAPVGGRFTNFASGEPNDAGGSGVADCLRMTASGLWRDGGCNTTLRPLCESGTR